MVCKHRITLKYLGYNVRMYDGSIVAMERKGWAGREVVGCQYLRPKLNVMNSLLKCDRNQL